MSRLFALVLGGSPEVDQALLGLAHEALELLLELGVRPAMAVDARLRILQSLDREVDLAVFLDGDDLGLHAVVHVEVVLDTTNVVPVDLGDVHEADLAVLERQEGSVGGDSLDGGLHDGSDF